MRKLKVCTAIRDKDFEDSIHSQVDKLGHEFSTVTIEDVVNGARVEDQIFIIEDSYKSILDLIEFHNSCKINFIPVLFITNPQSKYKDWVKHVRFPYKYFTIEGKLLPYMMKRLITVLDNLRLSKMEEYIASYMSFIMDTVADDTKDFSEGLQNILLSILDFLYAERGSIMLKNDKGNLTIAASTKTRLIGLESEYNPESVAWSVMDSQTPCFVSDITKDSRFKKNFSKGYAKDYFLTIPIFIKGKIYGVLNLSDKSVSLLFDDIDLKRANKFLRMLEPVLLLYYMDSKYRTAKQSNDNVDNVRQSSIHMLVHDIKLPLSAIKGNLEILKMSGSLGEAESQFTDTAIASCEDITIMINSLLDLYKLRIGKLIPKKESVDLKYIIDEIITNFINYARTMNVEIATAVKSESLEITSDAELLSRILGNLITNALKSMDSSRRGEIVIAVEEYDEHIEISVKDNGVGIPDDKMDQVFEAGTTYNSANSHGFGLAFVNKAVKILGGDITVTSEPGATEFKFTIIK